MNDTSPLTSPPLWPSADLQSSSENKSPARLSSERLQAALEKRLRATLPLNGLGSMIYSSVWKPHITPAGRAIYRLRASARRTSAKEPSSEQRGWTTPQAHDTTGRSLGQKDLHGTKHGCACLVREADLTGWGAPRVGGNGQGSQTMDEAGETKGRIEQQAMLTGWPTASTRDHKGGYEGGRMRNGQISTDTLDVTAQLSGWATPVGQQANGTPEAFLDRKRKSMERGSQSMGVCLSDLNMQAQAWAGWPTPNTPNGGRSVSTEKMDATGRTADGKKHTALLEHAVKFANGPMRLTARGELLTGSSAEMGSGGQLNPRFSAWLMGYPPSWCVAALSCQLPSPSRQRQETAAASCDSGVTAMPSSRKQRPSSSKPSTPPTMNVFD